MSLAFRSADMPAEAAAKLLNRLGLAILFIGLPCVGVFWRGAIYVFLPVGAILILIGALLDAPRQAGRRLLDMLVSPGGAAALFFALWLGLSLIWTPFPAQAGARFLQFSAAAFLAALAAISLPHRVSTFALYFLPAGVGLASAATLALTYIEPPWFSAGLAFGETLSQRAMITAIVLVWPALGFLSLREHWIAASVLALLVAAVALAGFAQIALLAMGAGALVFVAAMSSAEKTARLAAWFCATLVMLSPLFPFIYRQALPLLGIEPSAGSTTMLVWGSLVQSQWPRLITGHGSGFVNSGLSFGYLPAGTPRSLLFLLWYDLGMIGAAGFTALVALALKGAGRLAPEAAPAVLAGLVTALTIAVLGIAASQIWWLTLLACDAIAFAVLIKGVDKARRPDVRAIHTIGPQPTL
jgi:hypothetical protein